MRLTGQTVVNICQFALNRMRSHFNDPDTFAPERWLPPDQRPDRFETDDRDAFKPFHMGARRCIGSK